MKIWRVQRRWVAGYLNRFSLKKIRSVEQVITCAAIVLLNTNYDVVAILLVAQLMASAFGRVSFDYASPSEFH